MTHALQGLFITGTGTDVGKTMVAAALARALWQCQCPIAPIKPVQTGITGAESGDAATCAAALHDIAVPEALQPRALRLYALPASPHLAAAAQGAEICVRQLADEVESAAQRADCPLLVEGAGGAMVPLNEKESTLDLMQRLALPVLLVMRNELGALNQALLTLEALRLRGLEVLGVVSVLCGEAPLGGAAVLRDNVKFLRRQVPKVWEVPFVPEFAASAGVPGSAAWDAASMALTPLAHMLALRWGGAEATKDAQPTGNAGLTSQAQADAVPQDLLAWDREHLWHPYTSAVSPLPVLEVQRTEGTRLWLRDGRSLVDGMASWWCAVHGYGHPALVQAAQEQVGRMSHVMFGGLTHAPAVHLGQKLLPLLPAGLARIFWADSGSVAVEVALKMALQCQQGRGETQRTRILAPRGGYHGDTMGAMSVCDPVTGMHSLFQGAVAKQIFVPRPGCRFDDPFDPLSTRELEDAFAQHGNTLAAAIVEPVVQGAGGMWFYHPEYLCVLRRLCDRHGVLLIFDEIATGFGRTGKLFATEWTRKTGETGKDEEAALPDILCLGKALTGGMMTLSATACTEKVAQDICARDGVFMHGPTFMANPLACAVGLASLNLLLDSPWQERITGLENKLKAGLEPCRKLQGVADVRVLGGIGVVETTSPVPVAALQRFFVAQGVWIRPFARLIYLMPPYTASVADVEQLTQAVCEALRQGVHLS